jgi:hypothetical protein
MKNVFRKLEHDSKNLAKGVDPSSGGAPLQQNLEKKRTMMYADGVGDLDEIGEFGLGLAPRYAKPVTKIEISKAKEEEIARMQADDDDVVSRDEFDEEDASKLEILKLKKQRDKKRKMVDRQSAFLEFKNAPDGK